MIAPVAAPVAAPKPVGVSHEFRIKEVIPPRAITVKHFVFIKSISLAD
jgi:hypothetical protein